MDDVTLISAGLGLVVGIVLALTGAGGTILAIPLLVFSMGLSIQQAAPIALLAILVASLVGALQGLNKGIVRYKAAMLIALLGVICAPVGVVLAHWLPLPMLNGLFAGILIAIAFRSWKSAHLAEESNSNTPPPACTINPATSRLFWTAPCTRSLIATGGLAGLLSGLLGVGGGFVVVPSLQRVSNFNQATIIATTLAAVALISISSLAAYGAKSDIAWQIAIPFTISTTLVMLALNSMRDIIPTSLSQKGFALLCLIAAISLAMNAVQV
jgi:uncharacterized membrane protein YfcA